MISTLVELGGFACLVAAAWMLSPIFGLALLGAVLILVGYVVGGNR